LRLEVALSVGEAFVRIALGYGSKTGEPGIGTRGRRVTEVEVLRAISMIFFLRSRLKDRSKISYLGASQHQRAAIARGA
jgi:hypothetical protein